jgi:hypothetical protein
MFEKIKSTSIWVPDYILKGITNKYTNKGGMQRKVKHIYICICDHFEPYWAKAGKQTAKRRIQQWIDEYPKIADKLRDSDGHKFKYSFFYPEEQSNKEDLNILSELCRAGYGEVEIHLHHHNDTAENLRRSLNEFKYRLHEVHGLLSVDKETEDIVYGFIHGNWALDNSRPDGLFCGVNNELDILQQTGCYADFTMPSAPNITQTRKINSIYYAIDDPSRPKSHNNGVDAAVGEQGNGLLMVQGPLGLNWKNRKKLLFPRIENGGLMASNPMTIDRVKIWVDEGVHVKGAQEHVFIKLYSHGAQEQTIDMFFKDNGLIRLFENLQQYSSEIGAELHYVSARELVNVILALIKGKNGTIEERCNFRYKFSS